MTASLCPRCGTSRSPTVADGLCPHCLLSGLLETAPVERLGEEAGDPVGPYELVELIGEGGMGSVWRARQLHPVEREVALKIIKLGMDTREVVSRFDAERRSLAAMDHPGIARVFEAGATVEGRPYFVMELVEGEPITEYCRTRKLDLEERLRLFMELCAAVEHAHRKGIIHRDLKPSNVLVTATPDGARPKVIDFGIAKTFGGEADGRTFATQAGHAIGTPGYMSPEQAGAEMDIDTRADVYALGALLYEILTGSAPLGKETFREAAHAEVMRLIRETDPPRPSTRIGPAIKVNAAARVPITRDLDRIVMKALARERERRYGGATSLGEDIRRFLNHEPVSATDPTLAYRSGKFLRKHRVAVAFAGVLLAVMAIALVTTRRGAAKARQAAQVAEAARLETRAVLADSYRETGLERARDQRHAEAALWFTQAALTAVHDPERVATNLLRAALHGDQALPLRRYLKRRKVRGGLLRFDATSSFLLEVGEDSSPVVFEVESGEQLSLDPLPSVAAFLPGSASLVSGTSDGRVRVRDLADGSVVDLFDVPGEAICALAISSDGDRILAGGKHPRVWSRRADAFVSGPLEHPEPVRVAFFSADGRQVLTVDRSDSLRIFPVAVGRPEPLFPAIATNPGSVRVGERHLTSRWATTGRLLVNIGQRILEVDATSGEVLGPFPRIGLGYDADVSSDGSLLVTPAGLRRYDRPDYLFRRSVGHARFLPDASGIYAMNVGAVLNLDGSQRGVTAPGGGRDVAFSPDGTLLAAREATGIRIHQLVQPKPFVRVTAPFAELIVVSADHTLLTCGGSRQPGPLSSLTRVFRVEDGQPVGPLIETGAGLRCAAFVPEGGHLITGGVQRIPGQEATEEGPAVLQLWDAATGARVAGPLTLPSEPLVVRTHPTEPWLAVLCRNGAILRVDPLLQEILTLLPGEETPGDIRGVEMVFSGDGGTLYASGPHFRIRALDLSSGELKFPPVQRADFAQFLQVRGDKLFSLTNERADPWLIDARDGRALEMPESLTHAYQSWGSELSADASAVLYMRRNRVAVLDLATGTERGPNLIAGDLAFGFSRFVPGTSWAVSALAVRNQPQSLVVWDSRSGAEISPRWPLRGRQRFGDMVLTGDERHAVLAVKGEGFVIVKLDELRARAGDLSLAPDENTLTWAELQAAHRIVSGRSIRLDSQREWYPLWADFMVGTPRRLPSLKPSRETLLRWHRNQEAYFGAGSAPGRWHRTRLDELEN